MFITVSLTNRLILHKISATLVIVLTVALISQKIILELNKNSQLRNMNTSSLVNVLHSTDKNILYKVSK